MMSHLQSNYCRLERVTFTNVAESVVVRFLLNHFKRSFYRSPLHVADDAFVTKSRLRDTFARRTVFNYERDTFAEANFFVTDFEKCHVRKNCHDFYDVWIANQYYK